MPTINFPSLLIQTLGLLLLLSSLPPGDDPHELVFVGGAAAAFCASYDNQFPAATTVSVTSPLPPFLTSSVKREMAHIEASTPPVYNNNTVPTSLSNNNQATEIFDSEISIDCFEYLPVTPDTTPSILEPSVFVNCHLTTKSLFFDTLLLKDIQDNLNQHTDVFFDCLDVLFTFR